MQNACMTTITIRNVSEATHAELVARAAERGRSLQEFLKAVLDDTAQKPDMQTLMARARERVRNNPNTLTTEKIIEYLDEIRQ